MILADSHCHLDDTQFDADRREVIDRARAADIRYLLAIGTGNGPPDLEAALRIASAEPDIWATVGVHPNDAVKATQETFPRLEELLAQEKAVALGEIGLDYHWGVPKESQLPVFERQLAIARNVKMPVVIHTRDAWDDTLAILRRDWAASSLPCILHCFTGTAEQARECTDLGFYLAFGGAATFPKSAVIREAATRVPLERVLVETDAPYLAPVPHRGKRNEPAFVKHTAAMLAELRGISLDDLAAQTTANFLRVFQIPRSLH